MKRKKMWDDTKTEAEGRNDRTGRLTSVDLKSAAGSEKSRGTGRVQEGITVNRYIKDRHRQRDIIPGKVNVVSALEKTAQEEQKPENSNNLPDGFNTDWLWTDEIETPSTRVYR